MMLGDYLRRQGMGYAAFGRRIQRPASLVRRYCLPLHDPERRWPNPSTMTLIHAATHGAVEPNDFHQLAELAPGPALLSAGGTP